MKPRGDTRDGCFIQPSFAAALMIGAHFCPHLDASIQPFRELHGVTAGVVLLTLFLSVKKQVLQVALKAQDQKVWEQRK